MKEDKPRRVYKRSGITHICFSGALFAPPEGESTEFDPGDNVLAESTDTGVVVSIPGSDYAELWIETQIGSSKKSKKDDDEWSQPRRPGSEGYLVFVQWRDGLPCVEKPEDAVDIVISEYHRVADPVKWKLCGFGRVHDRYDLRHVGTVTPSGEYVPVEQQERTGDEIAA